MRPFDFSPIDARLAWAAGHASRTSDLVHMWATQAISTTTEIDSNRGVVVLRAEVTRKPPLDVALALSDTLHQSQAALDNLVVVLRRGRAKRGLDFVITNDPLSWAAAVPRQLAGVPDWAVDAMRAIQPFADNPRRYVGQTLLRTHDLARFDRHRALRLLVGLIDIHQVSAGTSHPGETRFGLHSGGRTLSVEYPEGADVTPHFGADVYVAEPILRWPDRGYPLYPSAGEVAGQAVWAAQQAVDEVRRAQR